MTRITLIATPGGRPCGYRIEGHTGFAPSGQDIVCAALSFLSITCANALETIAGTTPESKMDEKTGTLHVQLHEKQLTRASDIILKVFYQGISDLQETYPKNIIVLNVHEWRNYHVET